MNGLIQELTNELKNNTGVNSSLAAKVVLESINNSLMLGVSPSEILENSLTTLEQFATEMTNENLKEVVTKFRKMSDKPTSRLQNMAKEAGLSIKIQAIKESEIYADPVLKHTVARLEEALTTMPEYRAIRYFFEGLSKFSYDKTISNILESLTTYVNENSVKFEILNSIFEMRVTGAVLYKDACALLEEALLENVETADSLRMKMRNFANLPVVNQLINRISLLESKATGSFNLGIGNGDAAVKPVVAPFYKVNEGTAVVFVDNKFIKLSEDADPTQLSLEEATALPEFFDVCEAFSKLNFKEKNGEYVSTGRNLTVAFGVNENGTLNLKINGSVIENIDSVKFSEIFLMETIDTRSALSKVFDNLDLIVNLEFGKVIVNERLGKDSIVFNFGDNIFVFEKLGDARLIKKMKGLTFHSYVMENFKYDISDMYSIQLEEREANIKALDSQKSAIEQNLAKLETSLSQIEEALSDKSISADYQEKLYELKMSIEKNVNALKNQYIIVDQSKKKSLTESEDITIVSATTAKYNTGQKVLLKSGKSVKIVGLDPVNQLYSVIGDDNQQQAVKPNEIDKLDDSKYSNYQESGVDSENQQELAIKKIGNQIDLPK